MAEAKKKGKFWKVLGLLALVGAALYFLKSKLADDPDAGWVPRTPADSYIANPIADVTEDIVTAAQ
ncbi:MAG: hypothetical protein LBR21_08870 [Propionibacteriaceae bacterium]|jgi:hypothetical protein|nr:hypothetical protein [Propionibacteriaceae bacterium]